MRIQGQLFNAEDTSKITVEVTISDTGRLSFSNSRLPSFAIKDVTISPRVGNTVRYIDFPNGFQFETLDNDTVDEIALKYQPSRLYSIIHKLEAAKEFVVISVAVLVVVGWAFLEYGIPMIAREVAMALPEETSTYLGQGIIETLDDNWFEPTELDEERLAAIKNDFSRMSNELGYPQVELLFRSSMIGANAFALPNNTIIMTDQLVDIAETADEINAVLLHEIGHIHHRHTLRNLIESFSITFLIMAISGDVSAGSTLIASAPVFIIQANYSQDMELEADDYSLQYMQSHDINPESFATILTKLQLSHSRAYQSCMADEEDTPGRMKFCFAKAAESAEQEGQSSFGYLASHPPTEERIKKFKPTSDE